MASYLSFINRLLPFATPGTPLLQDLLHLAAICGLLYYAPRIQEWVQYRPYDVGGEHDAQAAAGDEVADDGDQALPEEPIEAGAADDAGGGEGDDHEIRGAANEAIPEAHRGPADEGAQPGPARAPNIPTERNVGAKKAKSLARRDQRRAYHEFQRSQGEAQRTRDAEGAAEREAVLAAERERRRAAEATSEAKKAKERELRREQERREREEEIRRRELTVSIIRQELEESMMCDLFRVAKQVGGDVDEEWVEKILHASGLIGKKGDAMTFITSTGWAVRVSAQDMATLYQTAIKNDEGDGNGRVSYEGLGGILEGVLRTRVAAAS